MSVYLIFDIDIHDDARYQKYKTEVPALVEKHGGEYLVRGADPVVLAGDWKPSRVVMWRWPSTDAINAFLNDPDYAELKALREEISTTQNLWILPGVDEAGD